MELGSKGAATENTGCQVAWPLHTCMHARAHTRAHTPIGNPTQASEQDHHSEKGPWTCSKQADTTSRVHKSAGDQRGGCTAHWVGRSSRSRSRPGSWAEGGAVIKGPTQRIQSNRLSSVTTAGVTAHILQIRLSGRWSEHCGAKGPAGAKGQGRVSSSSPCSG